MDDFSELAEELADVLDLIDQAVARITDEEIEMRLSLTLLLYSLERRPDAPDE